MGRKTPYHEDLHAGSALVIQFLDSTSFHVSWISMNKQVQKIYRCGAWADCRHVDKLDLPLEGVWIGIGYIDSI